MSVCLIGMDGSRWMVSGAPDAKSADGVTLDFWPQKHTGQFVRAGRLPHLEGDSMAFDPYDDHTNRLEALEQAVALHSDSDHADTAVLTTATAFLGWLRQPTPPATLRLHVGPIESK